MVREEQFAPGLAHHSVRRHRWHDQTRPTTPRSGLSTSVWSNDAERTSEVASHLVAGTVFVNAHGISAIDVSAPIGGWRQSGFGVELGREGMQAFARPRVQVRRAGPAEQESVVVTVAIRGGTVVDGTRANRSGPTCSWWATGSCGRSPRWPRGRLHPLTPPACWSHRVRRPPHPLRRPAVLGPLGQPFPLHGVTTVIGGNCGFSLAPRPRARRLPDADDGPGRGHALGRARGRSVVGLGLFDDWLAPSTGASASTPASSPDTRPSAGSSWASVPSVAAARPRSLRPWRPCCTMRWPRAPSGFSTSQAPTHHDGDGNPVPSRAADREEMVRLASAVRDHEGTTVELILPGLPERLHRRRDRFADPRCRCRPTGPSTGTSWACRP